MLVMHMAKDAPLAEQELRNACPSADQAPLRSRDVM